MKNFFVINGLPGSGKSLFGEMVSELLSMQRVDFLHTSSILLVKHVLLPFSKWDENIIQKSMWKDLYELRKKITTKDWDGTTKNVYWRGVMSDVKLSITENFPDFINQWLLQKTDKLKDGCVIFVDIREPESIDSFKKFVLQSKDSAQVKTLLVESDINQEFDNYSDGSVLNYKYDIIINNHRKIFTYDFQAKQNLHNEAISFIQKHVNPSIEKVGKNV